MPTFQHGDPAFDAIEYEVVTKDFPWRDTILTQATVVIKDCKGNDHPTPRMFRSTEEAESHVSDELTFLVEYWRQQLDDRERAIVCDGTHYRIGKETSERPEFRGFGGQSWTFYSLETGKKVASTNVWYQGIVPAFARKAFPDTHRQ